jgi:hypothetical protein
MRYPALLIIPALAALAGCAVVGSPTIDQFVSPDNPRLSWLEEPGAVRYEVQLSRDQYFSNEVKEMAVPGDTSVSVSGIVEYNKSYFWRVRGVDSEGFKGAWSPTGWLMLELPVPFPVSPIGETRQLKPAMSWEKVPAAARYEVQVSSDEFFRLPEADYETAAKDYFPSEFTPEPGKKYFWRVRSIAANGSPSKWSKPVPFTVVQAFQAAHLSPAGGEAVDSLKPVFKWDAHKDAVRYQVEVILAAQAGSEEPEAVALERTKGAETSLELPRELKPDTEYAWRVRPIMQDGPGQWSGYETFRTPKQ